MAEEVKMHMSVTHSPELEKLNKKTAISLR